MTEDVRAVGRWFPDRLAEIERRASFDEPFRLLCADFADAQDALEQWEASPSPIREQRCAEYRMLLESLVEEIRAILSGQGNH